MPDRTIFRSWDYNGYNYDAPSSGLIGPHVESGLVWNNAEMDVASEFEGIEKTVVYPVQGNVITGSGTATYHTHDA